MEREELVGQKRNEVKGGEARRPNSIQNDEESLLLGLGSPGTLLCVAGLALLAQLVVHLSCLFIVWRPCALAVLVNAKVLLEVVETVLEDLVAAISRAGVHLRSTTNAMGAVIC